MGQNNEIMSPQKRFSITTIQDNLGVGVICFQLLKGLGVVKNRPDKYFKHFF